MPKTTRTGEDAPIAARTRRKTAENSPSPLQLRSRSVPAKRKPETLGGSSAEKRGVQSVTKPAGRHIARATLDPKLEPEPEGKSGPAQGRSDKDAGPSAPPNNTQEPASGMDPSHEASNDQALTRTYGIQRQRTVRDTPTGHQAIPARCKACYQQWAGL